MRTFSAQDSGCEGRRGKGRGRGEEEEGRGGKGRRRGGEREGEGMEKGHLARSSKFDRWTMRSCEEMKRLFIR